MRLKQLTEAARAALATPAPRKGSPSPRLDETEFKQRFRSQFQDQAFDRLAPELVKIADAAWDAYAHERKSPRMRKVGPGYADPDYDLAEDWIAAKAAIDAAQGQGQKRRSGWNSRAGIIRAT